MLLSSSGHAAGGRVVSRGFLPLAPGSPPSAWGGFSNGVLTQTRSFFFRTPNPLKNLWLAGSGSRVLSKNSPQTRCRYPPVQLPPPPLWCDLGTTHSCTISGASSYALTGPVPTPPRMNFFWVLLVTSGPDVCFQQLCPSKPDFPASRHPRPTFF